MLDANGGRGSELADNQPPKDELPTVNADTPNLQPSNNGDDIKVEDIPF
jgi:hypothetical protein